MNKYDLLIEKLLREKNQGVVNVGLYPGSFTPPHLGHFQAVKSMLDNGNKYAIVMVSEKDRQGASGNISEAIWDEHYLPLLGNAMVQYSKISPVKDAADLILLTNGIDGVNNPSPEIVKLANRFNKMDKKIIFNVYAGADRLGMYRKSFSKPNYNTGKTAVNFFQTDRPSVDLGPEQYLVKGKPVTGIVEISGTLIRDIINQIEYGDPIMQQLFPPEALSQPGFKEKIDSLKS